MKLPILLIIANDNYFQPSFLKSACRLLKKSDYYIKRVIILHKFKKSSSEKYLLNNLPKLKFNEIFKLFLLKIYPPFINFFLKKKIKHFSIEKIVKDNQIKSISNVNLSDKKIINHLLKNDYSIIINTGGQIFKKNILSKYKNKIINIHLSLLPKYPGIWTMFQQMANHEKFTGVTIHSINKKIDSGKMILQKKIIIDYKISVFENQLNCYEIIPNLLEKCIKKKFKVSGSIKSKKKLNFPTDNEWLKLRKHKINII